MPAEIPASAFRLLAPHGDEAPVIFDSPHSGLEYPPDFQPDAPRRAILTTWDAFVDELFVGVPSAGATLLAATFPRAYIDANRAETDIDPALLDAPWPGPVEITDYTRRGMGLIRRLALPDVPMYVHRLPVAAIRHRIEHYYRPYRHALQEAIDGLMRRHRAVWHFNCHSMKSRGNAMNRDQGAPRPDIVVSDRDGTTAPPELTAWVAEYFAGRGFAVKINDPYRGGDLVRTHGLPRERRFSIQLELNRSLYLDEGLFQRSANFARLQSELTLFARAVADRAGAELAELARKATR